MNEVNENYDKAVSLLLESGYREDDLVDFYRLIDDLKDKGSEAVFRWCNKPLETVQRLSFVRLFFFLLEL